MMSQDLDDSDGSEIRALALELEELERKFREQEAKTKDLRKRILLIQGEMKRLTSAGFVGDGSSSAACGVDGSLSSQEKIALFKSLFRGRQDVFPQRWKNRKTNRSGYSPVCDNEWKSGLCDKPRVKCSDCSNQKYVPVTDRILQEHLLGRRVIGVYPLLPDDTCFFLAVDFDKGGWREDVGAFVESCGENNVPCAIERSRSGNGAHVWVFFAEAVQARDARRLGTGLLKAAMSKRHQISFDSYDRLFPNQDTMPKGGLGNLIALPFQGEPRLKGNSVFIDDAGAPFDDQWRYLESVERMSASELDKLLAREEKSDQHPLIEKKKRGFHHGKGLDLNIDLNVVLGSQVEIQTKGLPSALIHEFKSLAVFHNPEFYKRQALRLSTARTPRIIDCCESSGDLLRIPRGCFDSLRSLAVEHGLTMDVEDVRHRGKSLSLEFRGRLTDYQEEAVARLVGEETGMVVAPPGAGKTVIAAALIAERNVATLVLVHRSQILQQWVAQLSVFLGWDSQEIGQIGGGKNSANGDLDVAMIQSVVRRKDAASFTAQYGHVVVDECHHVPAISFERLLANSNSCFTTGLTATPIRRDGLHPIIRFQLGPIRFEMPAKAAGGAGLSRELIIRQTDFGMIGGDSSYSKSDLGRSLAHDETRNTMIVDDIGLALEEGRTPIVLTERRDHLNVLSELLRPLTKNVVVFHGGMTVKKRELAMATVANASIEEELLILATGPFAGEGFDVARLDTLFLTMPVSWKGTIVQYVGRLHRVHDSKTHVRVVDYVDENVPSLAKMYQRRLRGYRAMGYL